MTAEGNAPSNAAPASTPTSLRASGAAGAGGAPAAAVHPDAGFRPDDRVLAVLADLDEAAPAGDGSSDDWGMARAATARRSGVGGLDGTVNPAAMIARLALDAALPREARRALRDAAPVIVLVEVPTAAWVEPVRDAIDPMSPHVVEFLTRDARPKPSQWDRRLGSTTAVASPVVAITPVRDWLSPVTLAAADHVVVLAPLDAGLVNRAIALWTGRRPRDAVAAEDLSGLDLPDVAAALRRGARAAACASRLRRASRSRVGPARDLGAPPLAALTGYGEAHAWAMALVEDIGRVRRGEMAASLLEGAVFYGPPGTGKTSLARAIAAAAGVQFLETSVGAWFSQSAGHLDGVVKMVDAFCDALSAAAKTDGTAVGHADEIEAIPSRARLSDRDASWWVPVVTHVLLRFETLRRSGVVLLGSTNDLGRVDAALLRPGRLDRQFLIEAPAESARAGILRNHLGEDLAGVDLTPAARLSAGATGAVLAGHVRAARRKCHAAGRPMTLEGLLAEIVPAERRAPAQVRSAAVHEAGHAVVAHRLGLEVIQVSVMPGPGQGGFTRFRGDDVTPGRAAVERHVVCLMAGRAADTVLGTGPDSGSASDLLEATRALAAVHASFGLGDTLSALVGNGGAERLLPLRPELERVVEEDLRRLFAEAKRRVLEDRESVLAVAEALVARRVLTGAEVADVVRAHTLRRAAGTGAETAPNPAPRACSDNGALEVGPPPPAHDAARRAITPESDALRADAHDPGGDIEITPASIDSGGPGRAA